MKIAMLDDWTHSAARYVSHHPLAKTHEIEIFNDHLTGQALAERLLPFDIICLMRERSLCDSALIDALPNLKGIVTTGMHNAAIDKAACAARQIPISGTPSPGHATAELAMTLIGAMARQIVPNHIGMLAGGWQLKNGRDLRGATLGVLGLGRLGSVLAGLGKAYGMTVVAWSQNLTQERAAQQGVRYLPKEAFFAKSDYISIHLKYSERNRGLVGAKEFALMKPTAAIVNTSRAPIIETNALMTALHEGIIGQAAIDVYDQEPLAEDHPLRDVPNLILSPHIGYVTEQTFKIFYEETLASLSAMIDGQPIRLLQ